MKNDNIKNVKRKDKKGRVLRIGETQQADGRYRYSYTVNGKQKSCYSWKLEKTDRLPAGKRECVSLREQELEIQKFINANVNANNMTVEQLVENYLKIRKSSVKRSTAKNHKYALKLLKKNPAFCKKKIVDIQITDAKNFFIDFAENGATYSNLLMVKGIVFPAFRNAYEDRLIMTNPMAFSFSKLIKGTLGETPSLTEEQMNKFLDFIKNDSLLGRYYSPIYILFHTGLRISELCGLVLQDVDFRKKTITISHQLVTAPGGSDDYIDTPKTERGKRVLPLTDDVADHLKALQVLVMKRRIQPVVEGYSGFFFVTKNGKRPTNGSDWSSIFKNLEHKFRKQNPDYEIPHITPHVCRHTYCTNMARAGVQPKVLQYLMGHADIETTLSIYTHVHDEQEVREAVEKATEKAN